jgi:hypothetical protein
MKIELELPDYCRDCPLQDLSIKQINVGTLESPYKKANILKCYNETVCEMWNKKLEKNIQFAKTMDEYNKENMG